MTVDRDSDIPPDGDSAPVKANPLMVDRLIKGIAVGMNTVLVTGQTTQADLLSAVFTVLYRLLENSQRDEDPGEAEKNAHEIRRVLTDMLMTFGSSTRIQ
jgi:hypothetical protein